MIQRLGLGVLLVHSPDVFLLDEPASGLDPKARIGLRSILRHLSADGKTIIISSHILTELSGLCSHLAIMDKGEIVQYSEVDEIERDISVSGNVRFTVLRHCDTAVALIKKLDGIRSPAVVRGKTANQPNGFLQLWFSPDQALQQAQVSRDVVDEDMLAC